MKFHLMQTGVVGRRKEIEAGRQCFRQCERYAQKSVDALLAPFEPAERAQFLALLDKFVSHFNDNTRVTLG